MDTLQRPNLVFTVKQLRYSYEVFTSAHLRDRQAFLAGLQLLKDRGFPAEVKEYELTEVVAVTVKCRSDRAALYAQDLLARGLKAQGFHFPFSTQRS